MTDKAKRLARVLRVRTLQLGLTQADEARAAARVADEAAMRDRILSLAQAIAPVTTPVASASSLGAAAHYRERLHVSAQLAERRVAQADVGLEQARSATLEARRDQSAVEKLIARADAASALKEMRALENAPPVRKPNRHDPC
ncbi:hypothetical protein ASG37_08320 [Sphingomonas sp. Leaf407]|uniref:hypothetical protein n=1 Tax=unclassified Sphingomonas TaxID=196159 RepID=UPI0006F6D42A|nr:MULTISPECIES: hypothetical protein [unclassified Sphingomonas]KQN39546.1 hypothetical protein ASE97_05610 [Sphingomonas sp. Leaf42]KQT28823.1 hypothetical protein ASG37_08320 [Sphingomonas sp. Leaf407]